MNKRFLSIVAIVAIGLLSVANSLMLVRANVGAARLSAPSIPQLINYQGRLTDAAGNPINTTGEERIAMRFCLYDTDVGGSPVDGWCETHAVSVTYGVFSVLLGSDTLIPETVFDRTDLYLGVKVGNDDEMTPRRRVVSVGYAYRAEDTGHAIQADQATEATHAAQADLATTADTVDGLHASVTPEANKLVPLGSNTKLPSSVLPLSAAQAIYNDEVCLDSHEGEQDMPNMTLNMATYGSELLCMFTAPIILDSGGGYGLVRVKLYIDGSLKCSTASEVEGKLNVVAINCLQPGLTPGNHTVKIAWSVGDVGSRVCQRYGCRTLICQDLN
jgi:hypothetical protein